MKLLGCEKYRQMAKGSVADKIAVASEPYIPEECASEIYLSLSKDKNVMVRRAMASNQNLPQDSACRVLGRLYKDKDADVRKKAMDNSLFDSICDGERQMDYTIEPWYGFDVKRADAHCRNGCNYTRLIGELEAQDVAVVSIHDWKVDDYRSLKDLGFDFIPTKVSWQLKTTDYETFDKYLDRIKKGNYIKRRLRRLEKDHITFKSQQLSMTGNLTSARYEDYYRQWYALYRNAMQQKKRGRLIIKEGEIPRHLTAIYAVQNDKVLGGLLFNANKPGVISGAYGAFLRNPPGLTDVAMAKMVDYAITERFFHHNEVVNLGMDTNFYGFHLGTGLYSFKTSLGYKPKPFSKKREYFKVLNDEKFGNPYMYLSYPSHVDETDEDFESFGLQNNIFIRGNAKVYLDAFDAPEGIVANHNGTKSSLLSFKKADYFQDGKLETDYNLKASQERGDA